MTHTRVNDARVRSWLAVIATSLALSGCGGSSDTSVENSNVGASPVIARADAVCRRLDAELAVAAPKSASTREIERVSPRNAALEQAAVNELAKLQPPASTEHEWTQVLAYRSRLAHALTELAQAAKTGEKAGIQKLGQYKERVRKKLLEAGKHVGFTYCQSVE